MAGNGSWSCYNSEFCVVSLDDSKRRVDWTFFWGARQLPVPSSWRGRGGISE